MKTIGVVLMSLLAVPHVSTAGQPREREEQASEAPGREKTITPLRLALTVSRYEGEKKIGSLPYVLQVAANDQGIKLRMGVEVPVPVTLVASATSGGGSPTTSFQYRNVGANIDCRADSLEDGRYRLHLTFEQSSLPATPEGKPTESHDLPLFRTFMSEVTLVLRDGQTMQYVAATDPVTGESARIEATLTVMK